MQLFEEYFMSFQIAIIDASTSLSHSYFGIKWSNARARWWFLPFMYLERGQTWWNLLWSLVNPPVMVMVPAKSLNLFYANVYLFCPEIQQRFSHLMLHYLHFRWPKREEDILLWQNEYQNQHSRQHITSYAGSALSVVWSTIRLNSMAAVKQSKIAFSKWLLRHWRNSTVDTVEISVALVDACYKWWYTCSFPSLLRKWISNHFLHATK